MSKLEKAEKQNPFARFSDQELDDMRISLAHYYNTCHSNYWFIPMSRAEKLVNEIDAERNQRAENAKRYETRPD